MGLFPAVSVWSRIPCLGGKGNQSCGRGGREKEKGVSGSRVMGERGREGMEVDSVGGKRGGRGSRVSLCVRGCLRVCVIKFNTCFHESKNEVK